MRAVWIALMGLLWLTPGLQAQTKRIAIGSKTFSESRLLGELLAQVVEAKTEIEVERRLELGGTTVVFTALQAGEIDLYPEYTGTAWAILLKYKSRVQDPLEAFVRVRDGSEAEWGLTWLKPFGFNNGYAIAMREERAQELGISRMSDLAAHVGKLKAGVGAEFLNREDGWPGLAAAYGIQGIPVRGMEHGLAYEALNSRQIDLIDVYTTDSKLVKFKLRALEDDLRFFPPYDCAPVVRQDTLERFPELRSVFDLLAFRLNDRRMLTLNGLVEIDGFKPPAVARAFLIQEGLVEANANEPPRVAEALALLAERGEGNSAVAMGTTNAQLSSLDFVREQVPTIAWLAVEHLFLAGVAVLLTILVSVPLGIAISRDPRLTWLIGVASVIQTIPSLALLAFMIPIPGFGLGAQSAIAALFLYGILPVLRNTYTGLSEVDPDLIEAAQAMGLTQGRILWRIQLPLASNTIMAGIRTATVISIGIATLGAFIGAGGLGEPIFTGLTLNDRRLIMAGAIPAAVLAIVVDQLLGILERGLAPKGV